MDNRPCLTVAVPVYNEERTVGKVIERVFRARPAEKEVIVIDDGSTDRTFHILCELNKVYPFILIKNDKNYGKGACLIKAISMATADIFVPQDADLEVDPDEHFKLMQPVINGNAEAVFGSRLRNIRRSEYILRTLFINKIFALLVNILYGGDYSDIMTCFKMCRTGVLRKMDLECRRFDIEPEIACKLLKSGYRVIEMPIAYHARRWSEGKKIKWLDTFDIVKTIVVNRFR